jgi:hypothetical protein
MAQAPQTPSSQQRAADLLDDTLDLIHQGVQQRASYVKLQASRQDCVAYESIPGDGICLGS